MTTLLLLFLYLAAGYVAYRVKYPDGFLPVERDPEFERLRRTSRRRVLPIPERRRDP